MALAKPRFVDIRAMHNTRRVVILNEVKDLCNWPGLHRSFGGAKRFGCTLPRISWAGEKTLVLKPIIEEAAA